MWERTSICMGAKRKCASSRGRVRGYILLSALSRVSLDTSVEMVGLKIVFTRIGVNFNHNNQNREIAIPNVRSTSTKSGGSSETSNKLRS